MKKTTRAGFQGLRFSGCDAGFDATIENFKRRRSLPPGPVDDGSMMFFDRILCVKKIRELVFITRAKARTR
jgi:hypothetical protein